MTRNFEQTVKSRLRQHLDEIDFLTARAKVVSEAMLPLGRLFDNWRIITDLENRFPGRIENVGTHGNRLSEDKNFTHFYFYALGYGGGGAEEAIAITKYVDDMTKKFRNRNLTEEEYNFMGQGTSYKEVHDSILKRINFHKDSK